jgi:hypothetical protein
MRVLVTESSVRGWSIEHLNKKTIAGLVRRIDARFPVCLRGNPARKRRRWYDFFAARGPSRCRKSTLTGELEIVPLTNEIYGNTRNESTGPESKFELDQ